MDFLTSKISIIIPMHNCEATIVRCLNSIRNQTYQNYEALIIDDGSTDNTKLVINSFLKDSRFHYFYNTNAGVSSTRNLGIDKSTGDYIVFLDADDYIESDILKIAISKIQKADMCYWGTRRIDQNSNVLVDYLENGFVEINDLIGNVIYDTNPKKYGLFIRACWGKLFKTDIIKKNNLKFDERIYIGEDALFLIEYLKYSNEVISISEIGTNYIYDSSSATARYKTDLLEQSQMQLSTLNQIINIEANENLVIGFSNFKWLLFNMLLENSLVGFKQKNISFFKLCDDAEKYLKNNYIILKSNPTLLKNIESNYRLQYKCIFKNVYILSFFWAVSKIKIKIINYKIKRRGGSNE